MDSNGVILDRPYFRSGMQPVQLFVDEENVRAWPGVLY